MSLLKKTLYPLFIGCIIYGSIYFWGSYHTAEENKVAHDEFALLKHPVNSQLDRTEDKADTGDGPFCQTGLSV